MDDPYPFNTETTNFVRLSRLLIEICSDFLRSVLEEKCKTQGLSNILQNQKSDICKFLEPRQQVILYPSGGGFSGDLKSLDFTLWYKLLRNLRDINIKPHQNGWGKTPENADRSVSANIDRLREHRNEAVAHNSRASLCDEDFKIRWSSVRQCISEVEKEVFTEGKFVKAVDTLRITAIDPDTTRKYKQEFLTAVDTILDTEIDPDTARKYKQEFEKQLKAKEEISPKVAALIKTTHAVIKGEEKKQFIVTKAFCDAKEKLKKNRIVVIKGNTGDGKTATALQLLTKDNVEEGRQPLQLNSLEDFDLVSPDSQFIVFVDDIFGERGLRVKDEGEWNKRVDSVPIKFGNDNSKANSLIITVRNEIFYSLERVFRKVFTDENIIDLSSNTYQIREEKMDLLERYEPKDKTFSWSRPEKEEIVACAPNIGFPQCCCLFRDIPELQKERVRFFEKPFKFLSDTLSRLGECSALLFLFLSGGSLAVKDLDPNNEKVNKSLLDEAFGIDLIGNEDDRTIPPHQKKICFVMRSLDTLSKSLVVKRRDWSSGENVYRFAHDSIYDALAYLYRKATPIGFIRNCPSKCLSYLTTSETSSNMIHISRDHYTYMCERLVREFEIKGYDYGTTIASLEVWNDREFLDKFHQFLNDKKVDQRAVLNKACSYGADKCALRLLSKGVKPDKDTPFCIVNGKCVQALKYVINYLNDEVRLTLLKHACSDADSLECALYLLSIGVRPDQNTKLWSLISIKRFVGDLDRLKSVSKYLNAETKRFMLNKACSNGPDECASYLLSEGVKPDDKTQFCVVMRGSMGLLHKILDNDITPTARDEYNSNVLHTACVYKRPDMVTLLCGKFPHLVHDRGWLGRTPLLVAAWIGDYSMFRTVESTVLNSLHKTEDDQHKCQSVDGCLIHTRCACAQYMSQLVDDDKRTVLHLSSLVKCIELILHLCKSYPALTASVDKDGHHFLHYIARYTSDVDTFTEYEAHVQRYLESTGRNYDVTTILTNDGHSVLDMARYRRTENNPLLHHLVKRFSK